MLDDAWLQGLLWLALLVLGFGGYLLARRSRGERAKRASTSARPRIIPAKVPDSAPPLIGPTAVEASDVARHPIVLAHGFMGFDAIAVGQLRGEYFRGVRAHLEHAGNRVQLVRMSPVAGIRRRAEQLAEQVTALDAERVNIIAHSMGGLDARYAISQLGLHTRVASLTTIGTPHHGTPLADATFLRALSLSSKLFAGFGADLEGFYDLSTERMRSFNATVADVPGVAYASYAGWQPRGGSVHQLLVPTFTLMHRFAGNNDGIVPASSQRWGELLGDVLADHWAQIGWSNGFDVKRFYGELVRALALRGF